MVALFVAKPFPPSDLSTMVVDPEELEIIPIKGLINFLLRSIVIYPNHGDEVL